MQNIIRQNINTDFLTYQAQFTKIERFPKEFQKNWLQSLDFRFLLILMATFIFSISFVSYFASPQIEDTNIIKANKLHETYAQLLEQDNFLNNFPDSESKPKESYLYGVFEEAEDTPIEAETHTKLTPSTAMADNIEKGSTKIQPFSTNKEVAQRSESNKSSYISDKGLLKFITTDSRLTENPIDDIINIEQESSLSSFNNLNSLKIARKSANLKNQENNYTIRGAKIKNVALKDAVNSLSLKENATLTVISKNVELEEISSSNLATKYHKKGNGVARSPEEITRVMMSHNRAIQDCFKQALKRNAKLKGKIVVRFSVTPAGIVNSVEILNSTIDDDKMKQCILRRVKRWNDFGYCDPQLGDLIYRQTYIFGF